MRTNKANCERSLTIDASCLYEYKYASLALRILIISSEKEIGSPPHNIVISILNSFECYDNYNIFYLGALNDTLTFASAPAALRFCVSSLLPTRFTDLKNEKGGIFHYKFVI